ncbi:MAG: hypothetical protein K2X52_29785 [Mycobacteriaceae bacterium]|jgi:hypothetical protein|nr:hypothetical protein [Mycobacteriaceae bacterium]
MKTLTDSRRIFVFSTPAPEHLKQDSENYYRECRIAGAPSVEVELRDQPTVVISATRYLDAGVTVGAIVAGVTVGAIVAGDVLQVICILGDGRQVVMREFTDWTDYTVHRARP